jgi:hypothetical protein
MRRPILDIVLLFVLASGLAAYIVLSQPGLRSVTLHVYVLVLGALLMLGIVAAAGDAVPRRLRSDFEASLRQPARRDPVVPELERINREVTLATASAYDFHVRLLPHLREIAWSRVERSGRKPGPETLGRWWELLRPDAELPDDRSARGISQADLRAFVSEIGRM